jgi:hypothetical protein
VDRVAVLIPYRKSEDEERQRNVELVTDTWWAFLQSLPIAGNVLVSDGATRGEALMAGAREADRQTADVQGDPITVLILAEPGMLPPVTVVEGAIGRVLEDPLTVVQVAHSTRWLTREQTTDLRITAGAHTPNPVYDAGPPTDHLLSLQGCVVIAADTFRRAGGFDPRFTGRTGHEEGCLELCACSTGNATSSHRSSMLTSSSCTATSTGTARTSRRVRSSRSARRPVTSRGARCAAAPTSPVRSGLTSPAGSCTRAACRPPRGASGEQSGRAPLRSRRSRRRTGRRAV